MDNNKKKKKINKNENKFSPVKTFFKNRNFKFQSAPRTTKKIKININQLNHKNKKKR